VFHAELFIEKHRFFWETWGTFPGLTCLNKGKGRKPFAMTRSVLTNTVKVETISQAESR
jgi:hypothetical protein